MVRPETQPVSSQAAAVPRREGERSNESIITDHLDKCTLYTCSRCDKKFRGLESVNLHIRAHLIERKNKLPSRESPGEGLQSEKATSNRKIDKMHKKPSGLHLKHRKSARSPA